MSGLLEKRLDWVEREGGGVRGCLDGGGCAGEMGQQTGNRNSESAAGRRYMGKKKRKTVKKYANKRVFLKNGKR